MFRFGSPELLILLVLVPVTCLLYWYALVQKKRALNRFGSAEIIEKLVRNAGRRRRQFKALLIVLGLAAMLVALGRPQFGTRVETVKREGQDIFVALDVSLSMLAEDIRPNRLEKAKRELAGLIERLDGDRVGIVVFAGEAFVQCPLTLDYGAARLFLSALDPGMIPTPGTALADAIEKARESFAKTESKARVLVVLTDGEDHDGSVIEAAKKAAEDGIVIHTVGIGTTRGVPIPIEDERGRKEGFKRDQTGEVVLTKLDEGTLRQVAEITGGSFLRVSEQQTELDRLHSLISDMDQNQLETREVTLFDEKFQMFLGLALLLLFVEVLIAEGRKISTEWKGRFQ